MPSELDELMEKDPLDLSAQDIDLIIEQQRKARLNFQAGIKPPKAKSGAPKLSLSELMGGGKKEEEPKPKFERRI